MSVPMNTPTNAPMNAAVFRVENLRVGFVDDAGALNPLVDLSFWIPAGEVLAVVGASGAGKSLTMRALGGVLPDGLTASGRVMLPDGRVRELGAGMTDAARAPGPDILYLPQSASAALPPLERVGDGLAASARAGRGVSRLAGEAGPSGGSSDVNALVDEALRLVGLTDTDRIRRAYPTELSGGMLQRVLHAHVRLLKPQILLADEPTSALDVTNRLRVLRHLKHLARETGMTVVMVTHDLALARAVANRIVVVERGRIAETFETDGTDGTDAFTDAQTPAGRALVEAFASECRAAEAFLGEGAADGAEPDAFAELAPAPAESDASAPRPPLLEVRNVSLTVSGRPGWNPFRRSGTAPRRILDDVSLTLMRGEAVAVVGASGAGKSTLGRVILGLEAPTADGIAELPDGSALRKTVVFQDSVDAVNPTWTIGRIVNEAAAVRGEKLSEEGIANLLVSVGLPASYAGRHPHEVSGGELQRAALARAMAAKPDLTVFDEALASLDASVRDDVTELLLTLKCPDETWLFITHDLVSAARLCGRVVVMEEGRIVESVRSSELRTAKSPALRRLLKDAAELYGR